MSSFMHRVFFLVVSDDVAHTYPVNIAPLVDMLQVTVANMNNSKLNVSKNLQPMGIPVAHYWFLRRVLNVT